ncbi:MAG: hypothetical protein JF625_05025 [Inquilinus limosus]|uniref:Uncharacterized protein n=1 Tax=Inquilinus limosus TaxID=171674 RepID=A0A952KDP0_9PROT|nr:hypothetical protein [Inquilinus limosus]
MPTIVPGLFENYLVKTKRQGHAGRRTDKDISSMTADDGRLPPRGNTGPGSVKTAERQAREARQDADRYARRGNTTMHAISLQAARDLEAAAAAQRADAPAPRERR